MNDCAKNLGDVRRFSVGWCFTATLIHLGGTIALCGITFLTGMGSFTQDVSLEIKFWRALLWVWTPLAMSVWNPQNTNQDELLLGLAVLWSSCVGVGAGFGIQVLRRWIDKPLYP